MWAFETFAVTACIDYCRRRVFEFEARIGAGVYLLFLDAVHEKLLDVGDHLGSIRGRFK